MIFEIDNKKIFVSDSGQGINKDKEATDKAMSGGWFHSGDLAVTYPDGYIKIQDRSKDIIISGGENISSIEIENAIAKHPAVSLAAVVAKPDEKWGETPCAFVELIKDKSPKGEALQEVLFMKSNLYFRAKKMDEAEALLREAMKVAPDSKTGKRIPGILERFFSKKKSS